MQFVKNEIIINYKDCVTMSRLSKISSITFKLIYVCLALSLVFACIPADANNKEAISTLFEKQAAGIVQYRESMTTINNSDYGGAYLDEDGKLVVLVVNQNNVENAVNNAKASLNIKKEQQKLQHSY